MGYPISFLFKYAATKNISQEGVMGKAGRQLSEAANRERGKKATGFLRSGFSSVIIGNNRNFL